MVSFGVRFAFLSGVFFFPFFILPALRQFHNFNTHNSKKVKHKKRVFLDAFTYAPLLTYYINQLYYIIHILLLFSLHRLLSLWVGNKFFLYDVLPSFMFSPSVAVFSFWIGGLDVVRVRFLCAFLDLF